MKTSAFWPGTRSDDGSSSSSHAKARFTGRMRVGFRLVLLSLLFLGRVGLWAQIQFVQDPEPLRVFGGEEVKLPVTLYNPTQMPFEADLHTRLYQANSSKAVPLADTYWKHVQVPPGQTVRDTESLRFPPVKTETRFVLQWTDGGTKLLQMTEVFVHPPDLLKDLKPLLGKDPLGLYDPLNQLKPALKAVGVDFQDLEKGGWEDYHGKLAILGPFVSKARMRGDLPVKIKAMAESGVAVVWFVPPPDKRQELQPSFFTVQETNAAVVVVQPALVANLAESPQAQLHLLRFARLALHPEPLRLPYLSP